MTSSSGGWRKLAYRSTSVRVNRKLKKNRKWGNFVCGETGRRTVTSSFPRRQHVERRSLRHASRRGRVNVLLIRSPIELESLKRVIAHVRPGHRSRDVLQHAPVNCVRRRSSSATHVAGSPTDGRPTRIPPKSYSRNVQAARSNAHSL